MLGESRQAEDPTGMVVDDCVANLAVPGQNRAPAAGILCLLNTSPRIPLPRMVAVVNDCMGMSSDRSGDAQWQRAAMNQSRIRGLGTTAHRFVAEAASV